MFAAYTANTCFGYIYDYYYYDTTEEFSEEFICNSEKNFNITYYPYNANCTSYYPYDYDNYFYENIPCTDIFGEDYYYYDGHEDNDNVSKSDETSMSGFDRRKYFDVTNPFPRKKSKQRSLSSSG